MKRKRNKSRKNLKHNSRSQTKRSRSLTYDALEQRQLLTVGTGVNLTGAASIAAENNSILPNAEGDVGPEHFVEVGQQTFTIYDREGIVVESKTLNQFFDDAGGDRFGEDLTAPRIIYDRLSERWFVIATGAGNGFNPGIGRIHIAFSQTSDPSGQWQEESFVPDALGIRLHTNATLGIDADAIYFATQNFSVDNQSRLPDDVSIFSLPKGDLFKADPTVAFVTEFADLDILEYGASIQFASNFDAVSDGAMFAFSTPLEIGLTPDPVLAPANLNSFQITNANTANASLSTVSQVFVGGFDAPLPVDQPISTGNGLPTVPLATPTGLSSSLIETNGMIIGAQTVHIPFLQSQPPPMEGDGSIGFDFRTNGINWFQLEVTAGQTPVLAGMDSIRGPASYLIQNGQPFNANNLPDDPTMDDFPDFDATPEFGFQTYFNPAIAINDTGLVALTFNAATQREAVQFGMVQPEDARRIETFAAVGLLVNSAQTNDLMGDPVFARQFLQLENFEFLQPTSATDPFSTPGQFNVWGGYSSVRPDPTNPNRFLSVNTYQDEGDSQWTVNVVEILPIQLRPVIEGTLQADEFIVRLDAIDSGIVEIEVNGIVTDRFDRSIIGEIIIFGDVGNDTLIIDHVNGDPTPPLNPSLDPGDTDYGISFVGGFGNDTFEVRGPENVDFVINTAGIDVGGLDGVVSPQNFFELNFFDNLGSQDGTAIAVTCNGFDLQVNQRITNRFIDVENLIGGAGDDTFDFVTGPFIGDVEGRDGDDVFIFRNANTNGSVNGGPGMNTVDFRQRAAETELQLFSVGANAGFNGRSVNGPIGEFNAVVDQFRDISLIRGSNDMNLFDLDSIQALNQFEATYTIQNSVFAEGQLEERNPFDDTFSASALEQDGRTLFISDFDIFKGSVLDDVYNVQSNEISQIVLDGRTGDDTFNFASDSPLNMGITSDIGGLIFVEGGGGNNSIIASNEGLIISADYLILGARISGPVEVVFTDANGGNFDVTIIGSSSEGDTFTLQSFNVINTLNVFGLGGDDEFIIQDLSQAEANLFGGEGDDDYIIELADGADDRNVIINDSVGSENDQAIITGSILDDIFIVDVDSFESDQFLFIGVEEFGFDGRGGNDEFYVRGVSILFPIFLLGGAGDDVFHVSSNAPINLGTLDTINNDFSIDGESGINQIIISNENGSAVDATIQSSQITGLFNGVLTYLSTNGVFGSIDITGSNGGDDRFTIASFLEQNSLMIDGRLGEDEFVFGDQSGGIFGGVIVVEGGSDGDTYSISLANFNNPNVTIQDSGFSGTDVLNISGTEDDELINLTDTSVSSGSRTITVGDFLEQVIVSGNGGDDVFVVSNVPVGLAALFGGEGDDRFEISAAALGNVTADGQVGSDQYIVNFAASGSRTVNIVDSGADGTDQAMLFGTNASEVFGINNDNVSLASQSVVFDGTMESLSIVGRDGADVFNVAEAELDLSLDGQAGNDVFNLSSNAPAQTGNASAIIGDLFIEGGGGLNRLNVTNFNGTASVVTVTSTTITGLIGGVINYSSTNGSFARPDGQIGGIQITGSNDSLQSDRYDVNSLSIGDTIRINGQAGDDVFNIGNGIAGDSLFDGGNGSDTYNFQFGSDTEREIVIEDSGTTGIDTLSLIGSEQNDNIVVSSAGISDGSSTLSFDVPLNVIEIMGLGGNDTFTINGGQTSVVSLHGNTGNDTFFIESTAGIDDLNLFAGTDDDTFNFNGSAAPTRIDAFGAVGSDVFNVGAGAFGQLFLDGEAGADSYNVIFAGNGARRIDTRDTGAAGNDITTVLATAGNDRIAIRTTRFLYDDEIVIFDENTERVKVETGDGNDRIVVFGSRSQLVDVAAGEGDDNFVINGGSRADVMNLRGNAGDDVFLVRKTSVDTTTNLFGDSGNDRFNVGSTVGQNLGNLGLVRGELNIFGGSNATGQEDQLVANDNAVNAAYSYRIAPGNISAIPGPANLPRANFAGINFDSNIEFVRVDGTPQANLFEVVASQTTRLFIDGKAPNNTNADRLNLVFQPNDGRDLNITNQAAGDGFITFTNGNKMVQFENIELATLAGSGNGNLTLPPGFDLGATDDFFSTADLPDWEEIELDIS